MRRISESKYLVNNYEEFKVALARFAADVVKHNKDDKEVNAVNIDDPEYHYDDGVEVVVVFDYYRTALARYVTAQYVLQSDFNQG